MVDAARAEPGLRDREAPALLADEVRGGHADVFEEDLAVALLVLVAEDRQGPYDGHTRRVHRHQDHRLLRVGVARGVGLAHHDHHGALGLRGPADPPLPAVDDVVVAVAADLGGDVRGVG